MTRIIPDAAKVHNAEGSVKQGRQVRDAARDYLGRGWKPVRIPWRKKHPTHRDWQREEISENNVAKHFNGMWLNIGVQHGPVSHGLLDIDLDCREARALAEYFLPPTDAIFGRKSSPRSHWLYKSDLWKSAKQVMTPYDDPIAPEKKAPGEHGVRMIEIRIGGVDKKGNVKGALSMFPPSVHPDSGERVQWDCDGEP